MCIRDRQAHCQSLAADHGVDYPESLVSWLGEEAAQDLPVMMGAPPDVMRAAIAQLGVGRALR
eukprot:6629891-Alexandrium_andersonii.AAC.1